MTDEEAITLAALHGCSFTPDLNGENFFALPRGAGRAQWERAEDGEGLHFPTRALLAHAYCKHFNLGLDA